MELNLIAGGSFRVSCQGEEEEGSETASQSVRGLHVLYLKSYPLYLLLHKIQGF